MAKSMQTIIPTEPIEVTHELLTKYDWSGPRYTSYPTAPEWRETFGDADYRDALEQASEKVDEPLSIYVHLPFCRECCHFCGCNVVISKRSEVAKKYMKYLYREIRGVSDVLGDRRTVKQLHWGGGTPTYLSVDQIEQLFGVLSDRFDLAPGAEVALEVDPRVTTREQLVKLRELGFNRISMGVQDLDAKVQKAIGRNQTEEETRVLIDWCRELGYGGINIDLIYGLPEQQAGPWADTVRAIIDIRPDRLAVYSYAHLPENIKNQRKIDGLPRPTGPEKYELFAIARRLFLEAGYRAIGMDHFALPEDELSTALGERRLHRNFMGYTVVTAVDMLGFGTSAIGEIAGAYAQNEKRPVMYYKGLDGGQFPTLCGIRLSPDDIIRRWFIRQLMCNFYVDTAELERLFSVQYDDYFAEEDKALANLYDEGFLMRDNGHLRVLPLGQVFVRNVSMVFDAYLKHSEGSHKFSRTL